MRQPFISALGIAALFLALPGLAQGQIVRFGPGGGVRVRAPFVRVYVGPGGATSVRAPFTAVDVPGPRYNVPAGRYRGADPRRVVPGPYYPYGQPDFAPPDRQPAESFDTPLLPSPQPQPQTQPIEIADASTLAWHALRRMLRTGAVELDGQLDGIAHGQGWKEYLATVTLRELLPDDANVPPDSLAVDLMRDVLQKYDSARGSGQYGAIASLSGFRRVHAALRELVIPPLERAGSQLILSAGELEQALRRVNHGTRWISYLKLPDGVLGRGLDAGAERAPETQPDAPETANALFDALIRYDDVSRNPQYGVIAELPAFKATHERLAGYIGLLSSPSEPPQGPSVEELPAPEPEAD